MYEIFERVSGAAAPGLSKETLIQLFPAFHDEKVRNSLYRTFAGTEGNKENGPPKAFISFYQFAKVKTIHIA